MQNRFLESIKQLPIQVATAVKPLLNESFSGMISAQQLAQLCVESELTEPELLLALLPIASAMANPPISEFYVGAIAKAKSGNIYMGANIEINQQALFHSVHAEQHAISHAWLAGETEITDIVVNFSPCGHCRQFINELVNGQQITIHLPEQTPKALSHYLPYAFGPSDLNITTPLLSLQKQNLTILSDDPLVNEAVEQANLSYAPYSNTYAAVVLQTKSGDVFVGRYAENAAFNPSMQPMQMALANLLRNNQEYTEINRAILVESVGKISLVEASMDALLAVSSVMLEYIAVE
ncbi:cytidine deaminase [Shewanella marina]|uniref:cytidine deaminase n=1 Tax=Shewanella marina TaxID=487319 RepID=UPI00046FFAD1|nr:cytidine deaminase [Shewanella marina]